jgi:hypothetical protein
MPPGTPPDPIRATLIAILQQLNRVESLHEGRPKDQSLEVADLERMLFRFWAIDQKRADVRHELGLLLRNGLVSGARPHGHTTARFKITAAGKQFLVEALARSERIA